MKNGKSLLSRTNVLAGAAGVAAAGLTLGAAELAGAFFTARATPLIALGATFIDFTPTWLKNFAVETFGTADKLVLFISMGVVIVILAAVSGVLAYRRWILGAGVVVLLGAVVAAAVLTRAGANLPDAVPTVLGTVLGLFALRLLIRRLHASGGDTASDGGTAVSKAPSSDAPSPEASASEAATPEQRSPNRRAFFTAAGITAAVAVAAAAGGRLVGDLRNTVRSYRESLALPAAARTAPPLPAGTQSAVQGVTPFVTPNADFYRIDTALSVPQIDAQQWELRVHGMVEEEFTMSFQDLLDAELTESHVTLTCVSNPVGGNLAGNAKWLGYPLRSVLERARPKDGADMVLSTSIDGFSASTPLEVLQDDRDAMLAIGMNGEPLPLEHGYPVRMVVPGLYGFVSATKWVVDLEVTRFADRTAYWTDRGWSEKAPIKTASRIEVPRPFAKLKAGPVGVGGTAWAQQRGIAKVEVQVDEGPWREAKLAAEASVDTWRQWSFNWDAEPGSHYLRVRATDTEGLQTEDRADPIPNGASGWHSLMVTVE